MHQDPTFPPTAKFLWLRKNSEQLTELVKKYKPKMVFDSDYVLLTGVPYRQSMDFTKFHVAREFGNLWALQMMTSNGGELAELTGRSNPYPEGKLGVIEEGAYADILVVDGNPLEEPSLNVEFDENGEYVFQPEVLNAVDVNNHYLQIVAEGMQLVNQRIDEERFYTGATYVDWLDNFGIRTAGVSFCCPSCIWRTHKYLLCY